MLDAQKLKNYFYLIDFLICENFHYLKHEDESKVEDDLTNKNLKVHRPIISNLNGKSFIFYFFY